MPRRLRPVGYREALDAIRDAWIITSSIAATPRLPPSAREQLRLLADRLARLMTRDDGRSR